MDKDEYNNDDAQLAQMGHKSELKRNFSLISMLGLAFAILNSWTALSASLSLSLPSGGSTSIVWGLVTAGICNLCMATSLAEFLSAYPTAGGQYHWVAVTSWRKWMPILSWITGWVNCSGWVALVATGGLLGSQLIQGVISLMNPSYTPQRWHQFLIYTGYNIVAFLVNAFMNNLLPYVTKGAFVWSLTGFAVICITVLACAAPEYNSAKFVFTDFINTTGWPDGVAWLLGLLQGGLGVTGFDGVAHMIEEIPNPSIEGPKIMIACVGIGTVTGTIFLVVLLFVAGDINKIIDSAATPLLAILNHATSSNAGAICLLIFPLVCVLFAATAIMTTSSRMIYAFARDGGLPASPFFSRVHPKLQVPLNSLYLNLALVTIFGCIFLGSSSAFNAIVSASVVLLDISYGMPIAVNCCRGRRMLPERSFKLPEIVGWTLNIISLAYISLTTILFLFPPDLPATGSNMNYCVAAFGIVFVISTIQWIVDGRKNFVGPRIQVEVFNGEVGAQPEQPIPFVEQHKE
ncbi:Amino acid/polyamine transporter I [Penicillium cf. griseofulvum]|uniref:Amino acid/polyamine transporter I n=1 Tax=Penicillium cf. griseofulvum TaxID=2972120 RepID=A0A9W9MZK4_9EURO|nr:Amino acid/polyamine transporter I [Penicillium cf. griseofulvum]KAJ5428044.1 Amino acid/polyamine transporter I [Penicillium cf. griseofulvum]